MTLDKVKAMLLAMQRYSWEHGVAMQAFLESGDKETMIQMAREAALRQQADGRAAVIGGLDASTDPCSAGEGLLRAWEETGDPVFRAALDKLTEWAMNTAPRTADGVVYHFDTRPLIWVDSCYMLPPFLAAIGETDEAYRQMMGYIRRLRTGRGLLSHMWNEEEHVFVREAHWGVGNGWAAAGLARVIDCVPAGDKRDELVSEAKALIDAALPFMAEDGRFHDIIDDEASFLEVNFSQMLAYTIYRGVRRGWLDRAYLPHAEKMRLASEKSVDRYGLVQNVCGSPNFDASGCAAEGQAFYILLQAEYAKRG